MSIFGSANKLNFRFAYFFKRNSNQMRGLEKDEGRTRRRPPAADEGRRVAVGACRRKNAWCHMYVGVRTHVYVGVRTHM